MTIELHEHLQRYVHDQMQAGRFRDEDAVVLDALERHRQAQQSIVAPANGREEPSSQELQKRLLEAGIISEIRPPITDLAPYQHRQAVTVRGEPLSEAVIRERR